MYATFMLYSFFVICDTDDPSIFHIEMTSMKDYRLRFSAMKSNHNRKFGFNVPMKINTLDTDCDIHDLTGFHKILKGNSTYFLLEKKDFESAEEALKFKAELIKFRSVKHPHSTHKVCDSIILRFTQ